MYHSPYLPDNVSEDDPRAPWNQPDYDSIYGDEARNELFDEWHDHDSDFMQWLWDNHQDLIQQLANEMNISEESAEKDVANRQDMLKEYMDDQYDTKLDEIIKSHME